MKNASINILLVEDDDDDALLITDCLTRGLNGQVARLEKVSSVPAALECVNNNPFDILLIDYHLGHEDGLTLLKKIRGHGLETPAIFLTGQGDETVAVEAMKSGASDYLPKSKLTAGPLANAVRYAIKMDEARQAAEAAEQAKRDFVANVSHELRTPLNAIIGMLELVLDSAPRPEQEQHLSVALQASESLLHVVADILDYSKIEAQRLEIEMIPFSLRDCVAMAVQSLAYGAHLKGLDLTWTVDQKVPDAVIGDPGRIRQILVNLVGNAIKFTTAGRVAVSVGIESRRGAGIKIKASISDTGIGIPRDKHDVIFDAFTQVDSSTSRRFGGTGLGLANAKRMAELMGGDISVDSEPGSGSTFHLTVSLGVRKVEPVPVQDTGLDGIRILVIGDDPATLSGINAALSLSGCDAASAAEPDQGLEAMNIATRAGKPFRVLVLLAGKDSESTFNLAARLALEPRPSPLAVILMSAAGRAGDAARCRRNGIVAYLPSAIAHGESFVQAVRMAIRESARPIKERQLVTRHSVREQQPRLKILVAEDNAFNELLVVTLLERHGHTVRVARDGREAAECVARESFDLVLMDLHMPIMDGLQATAAIRDREKTTGRRLRIVATTARTLPSDRERCLAAGVDAFLTKPMRAAELLDCLGGANRSAGRSRRKDTPAQDPNGGVRRISSTVSRSKPLYGGDLPVAPDLDEVFQMTGADRHLLRRMIATFGAQSRILLSRAQKAVETNDVGDLEEAAHALKGAICNWGQLRAWATARELEHKAHNHRLKGVEGVVLRLKSEVTDLRRCLHQLEREGPYHVANTDRR